MWSNWSGTVVARPRRVLAPRDAAEVAAAIVGAREEGLAVRMVGSGHSFTAVAATDGVMLRPDLLRGITAVDREAMTVTALAGTGLRELNLTLTRLGLSLHNMGDIDAQTLAGAVSTGTHGTGGRTAGLAAQVVAMELVTGDGSVLRVDAESQPELFAVARVGLGALGVLTSLTLAVEERFTLHAHEAPMRWDRALATFAEEVAAHDYYEMYWFPHTDRLSVKRNDRVPEERSAPLPRWRRLLEDELMANSLFGGVQRLGDAAPGLVPPLAKVSAQALGERRYADVAHRVFTSPRRVRFKEMEYAVPAEAGMSALAELRRLVEARGWRISFPVEVRYAPADDVALSTAVGRDTVYLACHVNHRTDHTAYFTEVEQVLRAHDGRPHWGKMHTRTAADLAPAYPAWDDVAAWRDKLDPERVFGNDYLTRVLGP
ncbi:FAD-binding protein [Nocardioides mangrovicus]|uniref:FAD-binding protein n=1 Tax=Nocardioides mangrovicus TaxID=2478913 RepID=A0A3L8P1P5_9ACTN|nr:D-arabinono-1,4-lactone oxidase [Nocardioides mangrovicus]RLV49235.1 FAD-binding protein [Nocardioides mangrovicus]